MSLGDNEPMRKRSLPALLISGMIALGLTSCSDTTEAPAPEPSETSKTMSDPGDSVASEVGSESGFDCVAMNDCSVLFTVEDMEILDSCPGLEVGDQPEDTFLVRVPVLIKTKPSDFEYNPAEFAIWSDWSAETEDGLNEPLPASAWCLNPEGETPWMDAIRVGDSQRHVHLMDVPVDAKEIRLTETQIGSRWTYPVPELQSQPTAPQEAPHPTLGATRTPAPAEAPAPAPSPAAPESEPVVGFTGAPGVDLPQVMDKTIASCGDPTMHETGTTFFTDGTSGWTSQCAEQMGYTP